jgi:hypothetical protein
MTLKELNSLLEDVSNAHLNVINVTNREDVLLAETLAQKLTREETVYAKLHLLLLYLKIELKFHSMEELRN